MDNVKHLKHPSLQLKLHNIWAASVQLTAGAGSKVLLHHWLNRATVIVCNWSTDRAALDRASMVCCKAQLVGLRSHLEADPTDTITHTSLLELEALLRDGDPISARQACQSLHAAWLQDGNHCRKRFFKMLQLRLTSNRLKAVLDVQGSLVTSLPKILKVATNLYKAHLNKDSVSKAAAPSTRCYILAQISSLLGPHGLALTGRSHYNG